MRGGPQDTGCIVQIAVALNVDAQAAVLPVGERRADRGRSAVADAVRSLPADVLVVLIEIPQPQWASNSGTRRRRRATNLRS